MTRKQNGFTLIEMMIVVAIIGILAAIAIPNYQEYIRKSRRTDATIAISKIQQAQEKWRANNTSYTATLSDLGISSDTENKYYTVELSGASSTGYTVLATFVSGKSQEKDTNCKLLAAQTLTGSIKTSGATSSAAITTNLAATDTDPNKCWSK